MRPFVAIRNAVFIVVFLVFLGYYYATNLSVESGLERLQATAQHKYPLLSMTSNYRIPDPVQIPHNKAGTNGIGEKAGTAVIKEEAVVVKPKEVEILEENSVPIPPVVQEKFETLTREHVAQITATVINPFGSMLDDSKSIEDVEASAPIDEDVGNDVPLRISDIEIKDPELEAVIVSEPQEDFETMNDPDAYVP